MEMTPFAWAAITGVFIAGCAAGPPDNVYRERADNHAERCMQLSREIDALKGKPVRRKAAMDRYELECLERR